MWYNRSIRRTVRSGGRIAVWGTLFAVLSATVASADMVGGDHAAPFSYSVPPGASTKDIFLGLSDRVYVHGQITGNQFRNWKQVNPALPDQRIGDFLGHFQRTGVPITDPELLRAIREGCLTAEAPTELCHKVGVRKDTADLILPELAGTDIDYSTGAIEYIVDGDWQGGLVYQSGTGYETAAVPWPSGSHLGNGGIVQYEMAYVDPSSDFGVDYQAISPPPDLVSYTPGIPVNLTNIRASRVFKHLDDESALSFSSNYAGYGVVALDGEPTSDHERMSAKNLCMGFLRKMSSVAQLFGRGASADKQVVTVWPVASGSDADAMNLDRDEPEERERRCDIAVSAYDGDAGREEVHSAIKFFMHRGKPDVAEYIDRGTGPWLFAWAPGALKGTTSDDVLVLPFDLSHVDTLEEAEAVFQAWRNAIEHSPDLWLEDDIANINWASAIIRFASWIGGDMGFYELLTKDI